MKHIFEFIEKHSSFFKKCIILIIALTFSILLSNETINELITMIFGNFIATAFKVLPLALVAGGD